MNEYKAFFKDDLRQVYMRFEAESDEAAIERFLKLNMPYLILYRTEGRKKLYKLDYTQTLKY